jgi:hypothetical protein
MRHPNLADDVEYRQRITRLTGRHSSAIVDSVQELTRLGLLKDAAAEIRAHPCPPMFKLYILNSEEVFFGFYPITRARIPLPGGDRDFYDLMGKDAVVFHHSTHSGQPTDIPYIAQARTWFDSMWDTISYDYPA